MKLGMTLLVRDEIDIIADVLEYHLKFFDRIVITDNGSRDGTYEFLRSIEGGRISVFSDPGHDMNQFVRVDRMIRYLSGEGVDWVVNLDADEFLLGDLRGEIEQQVEKGYNCFDMPWMSFVPTWRDQRQGLPIFQRQLWRQSFPHRDSKAAHSVHNYERISMGNHVVFMKENTKKSAGRSSSIFLAHYPTRSWEQWRAKIIKVGMAFDNNPALPGFFGNHVKPAYRIWQKSGEEALYREWEKLSAMSDREIVSRGLVLDPAVAARAGSSLKNLVDWGTT